MAWSSAEKSAGRKPRQQQTATIALNAAATPLTKMIVIIIWSVKQLPAGMPLAKHTRLAM